MASFISHLLERLPHFKEQIEAMAETNTGFDEVARKHHDVCDELSSGRIDDPGQQEELEKRRADLEEELIRMLDAGARM